MGFTRSNYYCTFRQQTAPAAASANSPILTSSLEITKHVFSIILPSTDCSKIPAHSCPATAKAHFPPRRFWQRLEMLKNDEGRPLLDQVTFSYVQYWMASAQWKKNNKKKPAENSRKSRRSATVHVAGEHWAVSWLVNYTWAIYYLVVKHRLPVFNILSRCQNDVSGELFTEAGQRVQH